MKRALILLVTHAIALAAGFALGVYLLPILIAPEAPSASEVAAKAAQATYTAEFLRLKSRMVRVGEVKTFENFVVPVPAGIDPAGYSAVVVWCERFGQFITAAKYR